MEEKSPAIGPIGLFVFGLDHVPISSTKNIKNIIKHLETALSDHNTYFHCVMVQPDASETRDVDGLD